MMGKRAGGVGACPLRWRATRRIQDETSLHYLWRSHGYRWFWWGSQGHPAGKAWLAGHSWSR